MATEADLIQKFKDLNIPVGADFEELIHAAFAGSNLADIVNSYDSRIATVENNLATKADDSKVVHDNHDGTEQLNGVQVQPFNKLSDTIGGRNLLINTQNPSATNRVKFANAVGPDILGTVTFSNGYTKLTSAVASTAGETFYRFNHPGFTLMPLPSGTYTLVVDLTSSDNVYIRPTGQFSTNGNTWQPLSCPIWNTSSTEQRFYYTFTIPSNTTGWFISLEMYADANWTFDNTGKSFQFRNASIQKGNIATDSSPAPEDKVNVTDMRKPASDVAGIEEVNAKQDKIGYTPADDSKVAHLSGANNFDAVPTVKNNPLLLASSLPSDLARTSQQTNFTAGLQSGGVDVATAADLKSVADKAWHEVSLPDSTILKNAHFMYRSELIDAHYNIPFILTGKVIVPTVKSSDGVILLDLSSYLPIPKDDYKNYTVNSAILGPSDRSFIESDNDDFNPNYSLEERYLRIKFVNSDLVLYSTGGFAYFQTSPASSGATLLLVMSSDSKALPTIHFVPSTKS